METTAEKEETAVTGAMEGTEAMAATEATKAKVDGNSYDVLDIVP
jgi:hypothetical protein